MTDALNPLTETHFNNIVEGIRRADEAIAAAEKAALAGIDLSSVRQQAIEARDRLLKVKQVYFPGR